MSLISQEVLNILDGVSQQPDKLRGQSQGETMLNGYDSVQHGKMKRPPTTHVAKLDNNVWTPGGQDGVYIWPVNRDASEKYNVVVDAGAQTVRIFDGFTGQEYPVLTPKGTDYLGLNTPPTYVLGVNAKDTFVDTNGVTLANHSQQFKWTVNPGKDQIYGGSATVFSDGGEIESDSLIFTNAPNGQGSGTSSTMFGYLYGSASEFNSADYSVQADLRTTTHLNFARFTMGVRGFEDGSSQKWCGYCLDINPGSNNCSLLKVTASGVDTIVTYSNLLSGSFPWFAGVGPYNFKLAIAGNVLTSSFNGSVLGTYTDTSSPITAAGTAWMQGLDDGIQHSGGTGMFITNWENDFTESVTLPAPQQFGFRFTTIQDSTFIVNQSKLVAPLSSSVTQTRPPEALISIRQADYGTNYSVVLNGVTFGYSTVPPNAPSARSQLTTDFLASQLATQINESTLLTGQFSLQVFGSTIYVTRVDGTDFTITASDGLADQAILAIKGSVQTLADLPARALNGMVVEVQPDPDNQYNAAYFIYDDLSGSAAITANPTGSGIWRECPLPGTLTEFDPATMPWVLSKLGDVVSGFPADGGPSILPIQAGYNPASHNIGPASDAGIGDQGHSQTYSAPSQASGSPQQIATWTFAVDCSLLPVAEYITVVATDSAGGTAQAIFSGGFVGQGQIVYNPLVTNTDTLTLTLYYSRGSTPPTSHQALITVYGNSDSTPGLVLQIPEGTGLTFSSLQTYPQGTTYSVTVGAVTETYTPSSDQTAAQLATAIAAISFTGYITGNPSPGTVTFRPSSGTTAPTVSYSNNFSQATTYHNGDLDLAPGSLVGYEIQNVTDGSTGEVTANTSTTITTTLSGGANNKFQKNNLVNVFPPNGQLTFVFNSLPWTPRGVGDDNTNPFVSFTNDYIQEIGYASGRLILLSEENVVCSGANDIYNFFLTTVRQQLDSDRIDITANSDTVSNWHSLIHWAEGTWLWAGNIQAQLPTEPALAQSTVSIIPQTKYQSSPALRPLAMDRRIYFARERTGEQPTTQIFRYQRIRFPFQGFIAEEATKPIPTYLQGSPVLMVGDPTLEILFILTDAVPNQLYPYVFHYTEDQQLQQESWSTWQLDPGATILSLDMLDGILGLIVARADGTYFETIDLQVALYDEI